MDGSKSSESSGKSAGSIFFPADHHYHLPLKEKNPRSQNPSSTIILHRNPSAISISRRPSPLHPVPIAHFLIPYNLSPPGSIIFPADPDSPSYSSCKLQPISSHHAPSNPSSFPPSQDVCVDPDSPSSSSRHTQQHRQASTHLQLPQRLSLFP
ncbi:hypothetical protein MRB53_006083 [Persea americana]|uniref:Uncharacterized protein n=1 Tax=Persea americana TaxID=3435 RepID=A0ACC2MF73_PERAE|nr:hypothetical protein MRB53_006083 [Persea americana]